MGRLEARAEDQATEAVGRHKRQDIEGCYRRRLAYRYLSSFFSCRTCRFDGAVDFHDSRIAAVEQLKHTSVARVEAHRSSTASRRTGGSSSRSSKIADRPTMECQLDRVGRGGRAFWFGCSASAGYRARTQNTGNSLRPYCFLTRTHYLPRILSRSIRFHG